MGRRSADTRPDLRSGFQGMGHRSKGPPSQPARTVGGSTTPRRGWPGVSGRPAVFTAVRAAVAPGPFLSWWWDRSPGPMALPGGGDPGAAGNRMVFESGPGRNRQAADGQTAVDGHARLRPLGTEAGCRHEQSSSSRLRQGRGLEASRWPGSRGAAGQLATMGKKRGALDQGGEDAGSPEGAATSGLNRIQSDGPRHDHSPSPGPPARCSP